MLKIHKHGPCPHRSQGTLFVWCLSQIKIYKKDLQQKKVPEHK